MTWEAHFKWLNTSLIGSDINTKFVPELPKKRPQILLEARLSEMSSSSLIDLYTHPMFGKKSAMGLRNSCDESYRLVLSRGTESSPLDCYLRGLTPSHGAPINAHKSQIVSRDRYLRGPPPSHDVSINMD